MVELLHHSSCISILLCLLCFTSQRGARGGALWDGQGEEASAGVFSSEAAEAGYEGLVLGRIGRATETTPGGTLLCPACFFRSNFVFCGCTRSGEDQHWPVCCHDNEAKVSQDIPGWSQ